MSTPVTVTAPSAGAAIPQARFDWKPVLLLTAPSVWRTPMSPPPPAGKATTTEMGLSGYAAAQIAGMPARTGTHASAAVKRIAWSRVISPLR